MNPIMNNRADVTRFGAVADGKTDCTAAFQAAHDALAAVLGNDGQNYGNLYVPASTGVYNIGGEFFADHGNIEVSGDGWGSRIRATSKRSPIVFGIRRSDGGRVIGPNYRPDLFGKLGSWVVPSAGKRFGYSTNGDTFLQVQAHSMMFGPSMSEGTSYLDHWTRTQQLTIESCFEPPAGVSWKGGQYLFGLGVDGYQPSPFTLAVSDDPSKIRFCFKTDDLSYLRGSGYHYMMIPLAGVQTPYRLVIQIDMKTGQSLVLLNGSIIAAPVMEGGGAVPFHAGSYFKANEIYPFLVGADGKNGTDHNRASTPINLYGLRLSNALRYTKTTPQNDSYYFVDDSNTIAYFPFDDKPHGRTLDVHSGQAAGGGTGSAFIVNATSGGDQYVSNNAIRDIRIEGAKGGQPCVTIGALWGAPGLRINRVRATGALQGIGTFNSGCEYVVTLNDSYLDGTDCAYYAFQQILSARNNVIERAGWDAFRATDCNITWRDNMHMFAAPSTVASTIYNILGGDYGGQVILSNIIIDMEGDTVREAIIRCDQYYLMSTVLMIAELNCGTVGPNASIIKLRQPGMTGRSDWQNASVTARNVVAFTKEYKALVEVDGPMWYGAVDGTHVQGPGLLYTGPAGTNCNVNVYGKPAGM